jgi:hypothetical protein
MVPGAERIDEIRTLPLGPQGDRQAIVQPRPRYRQDGHRLERHPTPDFGEPIKVSRIAQMVVAVDDSVLHDVSSENAASALSCLSTKPPSSSQVPMKKIVPRERSRDFRSMRLAGLVLRSRRRSRDGCAPPRPATGSCEAYTKVGRDLTASPRLQTKLVIRSRKLQRSREIAPYRFASR